ncbi:MAG: hypothetical protein DMG38_12265 [Acidobacteria bacterium]|nr:MAG: hypothetical protein DMG38_12265 [Acidobacteriota bacterium]
MQVLGNQKSRFLLCRLPTFLVHLADEPCVRHGANIVTDFLQQGCKPEGKFSSSLIFSECAELQGQEEFSRLPVTWRIRCPYRGEP